MSRQNIDLGQFAARFSQLLSETEENTYTLADKLSLTPGTISRYQNGIMAPKITTLYAMAEIFHVNPEWLLGSKTAGRERNAPHCPKPQVAEAYAALPLIGGNTAGTAVEHIPLAYLKGRPESDYFMFSVCGDSMYPLYIEGDRVLVLKQSAMDYSGQIGVVQCGTGDMALQRVEFVAGEDWLRLIPVNPSYPPKRIEKDALAACRILGVPKLVLREVDN